MSVRADGSRRVAPDKTIQMEVDLGPAEEIRAFVGRLAME
jgi:hypothetical protein